MPQYYSYDLVFFFGAGASAPFGIPTMKDFVTEFENELAKWKDSGNSQEEHEYNLYMDIKKTLEKKLRKEVDLEAIFTVIDGIINNSSERFGLLSLYASTSLKSDFATPFQTELCNSLREKFQDFVRDRCIIPVESFFHIGKTYHDLFNRFALELEGANLFTRSRNHCWNIRWAIFTTNYDMCLEYYWRDVARAGIDTGFEFDRKRSVNHLESAKYLRDDIGLQLFKLHGSINWLIEEESGEVIEQEMARGYSHLGRVYEGELMVYPIAEKQLYLDPYISMLLRLNRELETKSVWLVIGYSFNDPVIREIFLRKSNGKKHLILVHPHAEEVFNERLTEFKGEKSLLSQKFGLKENFRSVNANMILQLKDNLKYEVDTVPT